MDKFSEHETGFAFYCQLIVHYGSLKNSQNDVVQVQAANNSIMASAVPAASASGWDMGLNASTAW